MGIPLPAHVYILGLLYLDGDLTDGRVLSRSQLDRTGWLFAQTLLGNASVKHGGDETYFKFCLSPTSNPLAYHQLLSDGLSSLVEEVQFGYYHHRAIFRFTIAGGTSLPAIRDARAKVCDLVRERCFDRIAGSVIAGNGNSDERDHRIDYVYSHSLVVVPHGHQVISEERKLVDEAGYDPIFTVRSTTFGLFLPQREALIRQRRHYVRISVPSTVVYADGHGVNRDLLDNLIDAIYYGGLYQKAKQDHAEPRADGLAPPLNDRWTNDLLLSVFNILVESVRANERDDLGLHVARIGALAGLLAVVITLVVTVFAG